ncbi:aminotransferase class IV [Clostridium cochlearium]|uniref:Aminotransferase class IV n=2 Tax=Clostridium cochlearium TaxID=1494 RepID=A0A7Y4DDN5_CLOCO|nr:aminotransferase class IV [Clostridium cochlearium]MBU5269583.1 aminotransferase class IV [Clostridium cochlearium]NOH16411.1 aminotransferase class IV [Clostridium cochlearium]
MIMFGKYYILNNNIKNLREFDDNIIKGRNTIYEVLKVERGVPLLLEDHIKRLKSTSKLTNLEIWLEESFIEESIKKLIEKNQVEQGSLKFLLNFENKDFICYFEGITFPSEEDFKEGVSTALYNKERENPNAKVLNQEFRKDLDKFIKDKGIFEAILVDRNGFITEGSKSNVFMVKGDKLITTPSKAVLPGITRKQVLDICNELNISVVEKYVNYKELKEVDGIFISSTPFDVLPVKNVDKINFKSSQNSFIVAIMNKYNERIDNYINTKK